MFDGPEEGVSELVSERDWKAYGDIARRFIGQPLRLSVAANSLSLRAEVGLPNAQYIWVDPPWSMWQGDKEIANGGQAPEPGDPAYDRQFTEFCDRLVDLRDSTLQDVRFIGDDTTEFVFQSGLRLVAWHQAPDSGEQLWYDDWYAKHEE